MSRHFFAKFAVIFLAHHRSVRLRDLCRALARTLYLVLVRSELFALGLLRSDRFAAGLLLTGRTRVTIIHRERNSKTFFAVLRIGYNGAVRTSAQAALNREHTCKNCFVCSLLCSAAPPLQYAGRRNADPYGLN